MGLGAAHFVALMSFHRTDPSLNNATDSPALNLLGRPGAILADVALQSLGLAAFVLSLVLIVWGWRVMRLYRQGRWWIRLLLVPFALVGVAVLLAALPRPLDWPLASGLGGATGAIVLERLSALAGLGRPMIAIAAGLLAGAIGASIVSCSVGMITYDAFSFLQVTMLFFVVLALAGVVIRIAGAERRGREEVPAGA